MPEVKSGESEKDYVSRCIPIVIAEGATKEEAAGKCYGMYRSYKKKSLLQKGISILSNYIAKLEHQEVKKQFQNELPEFAAKSKKELSDLTNTGLSLMEDIYLRCRKDNLSIDKSFEVAKNIYNREYRRIDRSDILRSMETVLKNIQAKVYKKWQVSSGEWHDYDEKGNVITVSPPGGEGESGEPSKRQMEFEDYQQNVIDTLKNKGYEDADLEDMKWDEIESLYNKEIEGAGGFVESADLQEYDFKDKKVFDKLNNMSSKELENLFEKVNLNPEDDPEKNFRKFTIMTEDQLNKLITKSLDNQLVERIIQKEIEQIIKAERPPKKWWDEALSAIRQNPDVDNPEALTGWVWYHHKKKSVEKDNRPPKDWFDRMVNTLKKISDIETPEALANWIWHRKVNKISNDLVIEKDERPPKKWWDEAVSAISENPDVTDPERLAGWVWFHHKKKSLVTKDGRPSKDWWDRMISTLSKVPDVRDPKALANWIWHEKVHKARTVEGFESPEPGDISEKGKQILASAYSSCRKDGGDKDKCAKIAWSAVKQAGEK